MEWAELSMWKGPDEFLIHRELKKFFDVRYGSGAGIKPKAGRERERRQRGAG